jgi:type III secretion protein T
MDTALVDASQALLKAAVLGVPRLFVFIAVVPLFPSSIFPRTLRVALAIGLGAPVSYGVFHQLGQPPQPLDLPLLVLKECLLGLLLGLALAAPFWVVEAVGSLTDNQRGANAAQQVTPFAQADASMLGSALLQAFLVLLSMTGAFAALYRFLLFSFDVWPVLQPVPELAQFALDHAIARFGEFVGRAVLFAAPMLAIVLLVDFVFSLMGVFAPQLQTYFAAFPIKSLAALVVLALYAGVLLDHAEGHLRDVLKRETDLLQRQVQHR